MSVSLEKRCGIAVVTIDNPPVNALSQEIRLKLSDILAEIENDDAIEAVVLTGAGRLFVGGADISELDRPPQVPLLPNLLQGIENATKPWTVAMHGMSMGGGVEIALACHHRVAAPGSRFGLPEVNLGIIPGAGGTQRLARLIGVEAAVPVVAENKILEHSEATALGLIDMVIEGDLLEGAVAFARTALTHPRVRLARERSVENPSSDFWRAAEARIDKSSKGLSAPRLALAALRCGVESGYEQGLSKEREIFLSLKGTVEAAALRYLFFAERAAPKPIELKAVTPRRLTRVGVVGGGTMGSGIVAAMRNANLPVVVSERDKIALDRARKNLSTLFEAAAKRGVIRACDVGTRMAGITFVTGYEDLADCDLVIEAVYEDLAVKREVFQELVAVCRHDAIIATNTSYIDPRLIAEGLAGQDRFIGLHFFSPAHVMKLLEIVPLPDTSPVTQATAFDIARRLGKIPVQAGICDGFIGNRILKRYRQEAEKMVLAGVPWVTIDAAARDFGYAMGPFEMQDLAGLDIAYMNREAARARGEDVPSTPADILVRTGRKGQKSGGGWYDYADGSRHPLPSAEAARALAAMIAPRDPKLSNDEIMSRLLIAMAEEGEDILSEGIARSPEVIDLVEVHGYGFPRGKGGPMFISAQKMVLLK